MKKKAKVILCHCCGGPAVDSAGQPKRVRICWKCIQYAGALGRGCAVHHPEIYGNVKRAK